MFEMKLKNILLTIPLALSISCASIPKDKYHHLENMGMLIQNSSLHYEDIFTYTKPAMEKYECIEENKLAKYFQDRNQWELDYAFFGLGIPILSNLASYQIDKTGTLAKIVNGALALGQIITIQHNSEVLQSLGWKENTINKNRYVEIFRWDY
jgi:hypothetical protein